MRSREAILKEIADLEAKIIEYDKDLTEIGEITPELEDCETDYETNVVSPVDVYDITAGEAWRGELTDKAVEMFEVVKTGVQSGMNSITTLLGNIAEVIAVIEDLKQKALDRIQECYAELEALDATEGAA